MKKVIIQTPIWKDRSIGIAEEYAKEDRIEIEIAYRNKEGNKLYPDNYEITKDKLKGYPKKRFGNTPPLYIVPIVELEIKKPEPPLSEEEKAKRDYFSML